MKETKSVLMPPQNLPLLLYPVISSHRDQFQTHSNMSTFFGEKIKADDVTIQNLSRRIR